MVSLKGKKGIALIMAMWIMTILVMVAASFVFMMRTELKMATNFRNNMQAHYLARAGIEKGIALLRNDGGTTDDLTETWYTGTTGAGAITLGRGTYTVTVLDESGMVNLNYADDEGFKIGTGTVSMRESLVGGETPRKLFDMDEANNLVTYRTTKLFDTIREVVKVEEIGSGAIDSHQDNITVYTTDDLVNINTAPYSVLGGLSDGDGGDGLSATEINAIIDYRKPSSHGPLTSISAGELVLIPQIKTSEANYLANDPSVTSVDQLQVVSEGKFKIRSIGKVKDAASTVIAQRKIEAVVDRVPSPVNILYWSETVFAD
jgi:DNA uptake protein ComE-like DNA-binding protein